MQIEYLGHSCFIISSGEYSLLFDPHLSGNPKASKKPEEVKPTHILVSHAHDDHMGDTITIAKTSKAKVFSTFEITQALEKEGIEIVPGNIGGKCLTEFGNIKFIPAIHSSGIAGGIACGFIVEFEGKKIYHAGDTALFQDMKLLEKDNIDVALLPIGDVFTMGIDDAVKAVKLISPKIAIPMHYNTFEAIEVDPTKFKNLVQATTKTDVIILSPGQTIEI